MLMHGHLRHILLYAILLLLPSWRVFAFNPAMFGSLLTYVSSGGVTYSRNYLVVTNGTWGGNLGGVSGANSKCLTDLPTYDWRGKSQVTLNSSTVHAFLCDGTTCNNLLASTGYTFAVSNIPSYGGQSIFTNSSGSGPYIDSSQH